MQGSTASGTRGEEPTMGLLTADNLFTLLMLVLLQARPLNGFG